SGIRRITMADEHERPQTSAEAPPASGESTAAGSDPEQQSPDGPLLDAARSIAARPPAEANEAAAGAVVSQPAASHETADRELAPHDTTSEAVAPHAAISDDEVPHGVVPHAAMPHTEGELAEVAIAGDDIAEADPADILPSETFADAAGDHVQS